MAAGLKTTRLDLLVRVFTAPKRTCARTHTHIYINTFWGHVCELPGRHPVSKVEKEEKSAYLKKVIH